MAAGGSVLLGLWQLILLICESSLRLCMVFQRSMRNQQRRLAALNRRARRRRAPRGLPGRKLSSRRKSLLDQWLALAEVGGPPRQWVIPRSTAWWDHFARSAWADEPWLENFRMTRGTFHELVGAVTPRLRRSDSQLRKPIPVDKRVAIALWFLSRRSCYRQVREQFGVGLSTVAEIVMEVCLALKRDLLAETVCLGGAVGEIMDGFAKLGFPHCVGAVDSTHIQVRVPRGRRGEYVNGKQYCSVLLQGTVDHTGRFIDAEIGWSGKNHAEFACQSSRLFEAMDAGAFVPGNPAMTLGGVQVPALIIADGAYPMRRWLMKPYGPSGDRRRRAFDRALSRARSTVEGAFGRLKSRWRCLQNRLEVSEANVASIITACVILHNICERKGHAILGDACASDPFPTPPARECDVSAGDNRHQEEGERVRDAVADFLLLQEEEEEETKEQGEDPEPTGEAPAADVTAIEARGVRCERVVGSLRQALEERFRATPG